MASKSLPRTILLLGATSFFTDVGSEMIFSLLPVFVADTLGGGVMFLGVIEGAADAVSSLLKLVSGRIADRISHRTSLVLVGYGIAGFVRPLVALATAPWHVLVVRLADRTGKGIRSAPRDALIADSAEPGAVGRAFGFHRAMDHAGAVTGPLLATLFVSMHIPVRTIFLLAAVPGILAMAALVLVREPPRQVAKVPSSPAVTGGALPARLRAYLAIVLVFAIANSSDAFLLLRARDVGIPLAVVPVLWSALHVSKLAWSWAGGILADRLRREALILAGWAVFAASYLGLAVATRPWQVWALFLVYGAFYGLSEPAEKALVKDLAPPEQRGAAFGAYSFVLGIASLPAGLLTGWLWTTSGPGVALGAGAVTSLLAMTLLAGWMVVQRRSKTG